MPDSLSTSTPTQAWIDNLDVFPASFLGLSRPTGGFVLGLEGQSLSHGSASSKALESSADIARVAGVVSSAELITLMGQARALLKTKAFKDASRADESEHGLAFWRIDDERALVVVFGTQSNTDLVDAAWSWFGQTEEPYANLDGGAGDISHRSASVFKATVKRPKP